MNLTKSYPILTDITLPVPLINYNHFHPPPSLLVKIVTFIYRKQRDIAATNSPKRSEIQSAPSGDLPGTTDPSISMIISWLIYFHSVRLPEPDPRQPSIQSTVRPHPSRRVGGNSSGGGKSWFPSLKGERHSTVIQLGTYGKAQQATPTTTASRYPMSTGMGCSRSSVWWLKGWENNTQRWIIVGVEEGWGWPRKPQEVVRLSMVLNRAEWWLS